MANTLALPRLVGAYGERVTCAIGLLLLGTCATGTESVLTPPWHALLFIMRGAGVALTDTTIAALIAVQPAADKATNLGLSSSVQAGARLVAPLASGAMLDMALGGGVAWDPPAQTASRLSSSAVAATLAAAVPLVALPRLEQTGE